MYPTSRRLQLVLSVTGFKFLALIALACACGWSILMQYKQANQLSVYRQQLDGLTNRLTRLDKVIGQQTATLHQIEQQTAALHQVLGNVFPGKLPPEWEKRLQDLEAQIADTDRWPKDTVHAERFLDQISGLVKGIPAWAEAHYLPRLSALRWTAMAFIRLHASRDPTISLEQVAEEMRALADARPEGGSSELEMRLQQRAVGLMKQAEQQRVAEAMQQARQFLTANAEADHESADAQPELHRVYDFLEAYEKDGDLGTEVVTLRKKLHEHMMKRQFRQQAVILKSQWSTIQKLQAHQPAVYEAALNLLLGDVMSARVALALEGINQPLYDELERDLRHAAMSIAVQTAKGQEDRQAKARRDYQKWALTEIKSFESAFQAISNKADEEASLWKRNNGGWVETSYQKVREAMLSHLLPIDIMLLDLPVQERYQKAFQNGWKKLDGRQEQTEVTEQTAVIGKQSLRTFLEDTL